MALVAVILALILLIVLFRARPLVAFVVIGLLGAANHYQVLPTPTAIAKPVRTTEASLHAWQARQSHALVCENAAYNQTTTSAVPAGC